MVWWGWLAIGLLLMGAELLAVDAAFYLVFLGLAAVIMGLVGLVGIELAVWLQWIFFGVLALTTMVFFRRKVYTKFRGQPLGFKDQVDGRQVIVLEDVTAGGETRVEFRGSRWDAVNVGSNALAATRPSSRRPKARCSKSTCRPEAAPNNDTTHNKGTLWIPDLSSRASSRSSSSSRWSRRPSSCRSKAPTSSKTSASIRVR